MIALLPAVPGAQGDDGDMELSDGDEYDEIFLSKKAKKDKAVEEVAQKIQEEGVLDCGR